MRNLSVVIFFAFCLTLGCYLNDRSWNGQVYVYIGEQRSPAAVRSISEYSPVDHQALYRTVQGQLMAYAQVIKDDEMLGLQLGHPILTGKSGGHEFGCQVADHSGVYDRMKITFVGTGISEGGEAPHMTIDARCKSKKNLNQLDTVWIPMKSIVQSPAKDQKFVFGSEDTVKLNFESIPSQWPEKWVLWNVRFYREDAPEQSLDVDAGALKQANAKLLSFDWK